MFFQYFFGLIYKSQQLDLSLMKTVSFFDWFWSKILLYYPSFVTNGTYVKLYFNQNEIPN